MDLVAMAHVGLAYAVWWGGLEWGPLCYQCNFKSGYPTYRDCSHIEPGCCGFVERFVKRAGFDIVVCGWCKTLRARLPKRRSGRWVNKATGEPTDDWSMFT